MLVRNYSFSPNDYFFRIKKKLRKSCWLEMILFFFKQSLCFRMKNKLKKWILVRDYSLVKKKVISYYQDFFLKKCILLDSTFFKFIF